MIKLPDFSSKLAAACVFAASYLPPFVGIVYGVGHCETCRQAWLKFVWILQGTVIAFIIRIDAGSYIGLAWAIGLQIIWLAGWTWLASRSKAWLGFTIITVFALSIWFTYLMYALIRM